MYRIHSWIKYYIELCVLPITYAGLTLAYHIWHMVSITMRRCVAFIHDLDPWPQSQIYRLLSCLHDRSLWKTQPVCFDISIPYLAHGSITMRGCVKYIHDPDTCTMLTFDLWPQGKTCRVNDMALHSGLSFFVLWHSHTLFGTWVYHHGTMCRVQRLSWTISKLYFTMDLSLASCLCSLT